MSTKCQYSDTAGNPAALLASYCVNDVIVAKRPPKSDESQEARPHENVGAVQASNYIEITRRATGRYGEVEVGVLDALCCYEHSAERHYHRCYLCARDKHPTGPTVQCRHEQDPRPEEEVRGPNGEAVRPPVPTPAASGAVELGGQRGPRH